MDAGQPGSTTRLDQVVKNIMLRRSSALRTRVHQVMDTGLHLLALWVAHELRSKNQHLLGRDPIAPFDDFMWLWLVIAPTAWIALSWFGFYQRPLFFSRRRTALMILKASVVTTLAAILAMFLFREQLARGVLVLYGGISFLLLMGKELLLSGLYHTSHGRDQLEKRVIVVGGNEGDLQILRSKLKSLGPGSATVVAELNLERNKPEVLTGLLHQHSAHAVLVHCGHSNFREAEQILQACELEGVEAWMVVGFFKTQTYRTSLDEFMDLPVVVFRSAPEASWQSLAKQIMDYTGALVGLFILAPVMLLIALLIRLTSPGPILFRQERCGLHGKPFVMLKFRTMVTNAEQLRHELESLNEMQGPVFKISQDPRVTPIGRFLRKYSLDELPQLINVLRGEMSLVGPRPLPVMEVARFDDLSHRRRLSVKPGLTCLWQISGRNNVSDFKEWVRLDLEYIDHWSLWLDLKILFRTIPAVLQGTGAR